MRFKSATGIALTLMAGAALGIALTTFYPLWPGNVRGLFKELKGPYVAVKGRLIEVGGPIRLECREKLGHYFLDYMSSYFSGPPSVLCYYSFKSGLQGETLNRLILDLGAGLKEPEAPRAASLWPSVSKPGDEPGVAEPTSGPVPAWRFVSAAGATEAFDALAIFTGRQALTAVCSSTGGPLDVGSCRAAQTAIIERAATDLKNSRDFD